MPGSWPEGSDRRLIWGLIVAAVLAGMLVAPSMAAPALVLNPSSGKDGSWVTATGSSFALGGDNEFPPELILRFNGIEVARDWKGWDAYINMYGWDSFSIPFQVPAGTPPGTYTVQAGAWSKTATATFTVIHLPVADFSISPSSGGVAPLTVSFTDMSTGNPSAWWWDFGDGQTSSARNPSHTYTSAGTHRVILTVSNTAGSDQAYGSITVSKPALDLSPSYGKAGDRVTATGSSFNLYAVEFPYARLSFDGVVAAGNIPMATSGNLGSFTTTFTVPAGTPPGWYTVRADGPKDSATATFTITNIPPRALIDASPQSGRIPLPVHFSGTRSYDEDGLISSYQWDFGDGASASGATVDHTYSRSGDYRARLTVKDNQGESGIADVTIRLENIPPVAEAHANPTSGSDPLVVQFDGSQSSDPDGRIVSYRWDFGDNYWEGTAGASHQYLTPQSYTAVLTVTDDKGLTGKDEVLITVGNIPPVVRLTVDPQRGNAPLTVKFDGSQSQDPDDTDLIFSWDFGDGDRGSGTVLSHTYQEEGTYQVVLQVTDPHGATGRASETLNADQPFPWWAPVIGVLGAFAGVKLYIDRSKVVGPGQSLPENCRYPEPQPGYEIRTSIECEPVIDHGLPNISVEVRSGILKKEEKR